MSHSIARQFRFGELLVFALPSTLMMMFMSLYTIVDGFFVSRYVSVDALGAVNITYPLSSLIIGLGVMFATGGCAVVSKQIGEGKTEEAQRNFTLIVLAALVLNLVIALPSLFFITPICRLLGADAALLPYCEEYLRILLFFSPFSVLQLLFQTFFVTAGRPGLGLFLTIAAGLNNMVLDYVFMVPMGMGISGAAYATGIGYCIPAIGGLLFFFCNKKGLHFLKPAFSGRIIGQSCFNGSSEMVTNLSASVTTFLFNIFMMRLAGADGVSAITVILYCQFLMTSLFMGFSLGVAPVISFHYGADNKPYLQKLWKMCLKFILVTSLLIFVLSLFSAQFIAGLFSAPDAGAYPLIVRGMRLFSLSFLFAGINIFGSALFTALSNGKVSAAISFSRTFLFTVAGILILANLFQTDGLFLSVPAAELITVLFVVFLSRQLRTTYQIL